MRTRLDHLVVSALQKGAAVPAFTCYDFTTALAVVAAAEETGHGTILLVAPKTASTLVKASSMNVGKVNFNTELRTGVLATLEANTTSYRADGENLQGLLRVWNQSAKHFAAGALAMLTR
jgi:fructose/tagatose bisphosphate aldolase